MDLLYACACLHLFFLNDFDFFLHSFVVPSAPRSLSLHIQNKSFILLQWKVPEHVNGIITDYQVTAQRLPALHMVITGQTSGSTTEIRFPYLEPEAAYRVSVLASNRMGTGPPAVVTFDLSTGW